MIIIYYLESEMTIIQSNRIETNKIIIFTERSAITIKRKFLLIRPMNYYYYCAFMINLERKKGRNK